VRELLAACGDSTDGELLEAYVARADNSAFAALVRRHGPLVLNVCRGVLHHEQDAEDAFQSVFLILAKKAPSIRRRASVAGWLYKVAHNVALKAVARRSTTKPPPPGPGADPAAVLARRELCGALDEEIGLLPEKYRLPLVLCYLEDLTTGEAARRLRWPTGTLKVRLSQARDLLRKRLARRGFGLSAGGLVSLLMLRPASAPAGAVARLAGLLQAEVAALLAARAARPRALLACLLVAGALAAGAGGLLSRSTPARHAGPPPAAELPRVLRGRPSAWTARWRPWPSPPTAGAWRRRAATGAFRSGIRPPAGACWP
jgi:RNA polymerase sigma factor (sigma-70 family)